MRKKTSSVHKTDSPSEFLSLLKILSPGCNPCGGVFVFVGKWHIKFETKFLQLKNTAVLNKEREENMKNFLRNMASLIIAVAMNMAALIIAVAMVALFITVVWMNKMGLN